MSNFILLVFYISCSYWIQAPSAKIMTCLVGKGGTAVVSIGPCTLTTAWDNYFCIRLFWHTSVTSKNYALTNVDRKKAHLSKISPVRMYRAPSQPTPGSNGQVQSSWCHLEEGDTQCRKGWLPLSRDGNGHSMTSCLDFIWCRGHWPSEVSIWPWGQICLTLKCAVWPLYILSDLQGLYDAIFRFDVEQRGSKTV